MKGKQYIATIVAILLSSIVCIIVFSQSLCIKCARIYDIHGGTRIDFKADCSYYDGFNLFVSIFFVLLMGVTVFLAINKLYKVSLLIMFYACIILVINLTSISPHFTDPNGLFDFSSNIITRSYPGFIVGYHTVCNMYYNMDNDETRISCPYNSDHPANNSLWLLICYYTLTSLLVILTIAIDLYQNNRSTNIGHAGTPELESAPVLESTVTQLQETDDGIIILSGTDSMQYSDSDTESVNSNSRLLIVPAHEHENEMCV